MFIHITFLTAIVSVYNNNSYINPYDLDDDMDNNMSTINDNIFDIEKSSIYNNQEVNFPKNINRSIRYGKIKTNPENLETLIQHEMEDISPDINTKIRNKLAKSNVDRSRYKDLFFIKKRIITDGDRKIVSFDIKEKIIPKNGVNDPLSKDLSLRVILAGILFLLAGLVFTTTMKMYQNVFKKSIFTYEGNKERNEQIK